MKPMEYVNEMVLHKDYQGEVQAALQNSPVSLQPFIVAAKADLARDEKLMKAASEDPRSMQTALLVAANAGLLPGAAHDQFYLIPRYDGRAKRNVVTYITGYKGLCDVAYRHPRVHLVDAFLVYEGEDFDWSPGHPPKHTYRYDIDRDDKNIKLAYAIAYLTAPRSQNVVEIPAVHPMTRKQIDAIMKRSSAYQNAEKYGRKSSPWHTDYGKMARKTPLRALLNSGSVPRQNELIELLARDTEAEIVDYPDPKSDADDAFDLTRTEEIKQKIKVDFPDRTTDMGDGIERPTHGDIE
jgi:phage RecT family recombinase